VCNDIRGDPDFLDKLSSTSRAIWYDFRPILTVQFWRKIILSCYVRHVEVWQLAELFWDQRLTKVNSVHRVFRANFLL
jgi:hypothetical protein